MRGSRTGNNLEATQRRARSQVRERPSCEECGVNIRDTEKLRKTTVMSDRRDKGRRRVGKLGIWRNWRAALGRMRLKRM